jgi:hypothetical protein
LITEMADTGDYVQVPAALTSAAGVHRFEARPTPYRVARQGGCRKPETRRRTTDIAPTEQAKIHVPGSGIAELSTWAHVGTEVTITA